MDPMSEYLNEENIRQPRHDGAAAKTPFLRFGPEKCTDAGQPLRWLPAAPLDVQHVRQQRQQGNSGVAADLERTANDARCRSRSIIRETGEVPPSRVHGVIDRGWNVLGAIAQGVTFTAWKHNEIAARQREWHSAVAYIEGIPSFVALADAGGARTLVLVPMLKDNELVGSINIFRQEVRPRRSGERGG